MRNIFLVLFIPFLGLAQLNPIFFNECGRYHSLNQRVIANYTLNNTTNESSGLSPNGTGTGIDYVAGITGQAARFNASTDRIDIADSDNFSFTDGTRDLPFSISLWVYYTGFSTNANVLISKRGTTTNVEWQFVYSGSGNAVGFQKFSSSNTISQSIDISGGPLLNTWYHYVYTDDGSKTTSGMNIYINGILQAKTSATSGYTGMVNGTSITRIGLNSYDLTSPDRAHQGYLEDIGIWKNRVLTPKEILFLYNSGSGKTYPY